MGKAELLAEIDKAWVALNSHLGHLSDAQMTAIYDENGWTVKDHLTHMTAWEDSVAFLLQGRPRHKALQVEESLFAGGSFDDMNSVIQQQRKGLSVDQAIAQLRSTHDKLMRALQPLTETDLERPLRHFLPGSPTSDERSVAELIRDNTADHFSEHLTWIRTLVGTHD